MLELVIRSAGKGAEKPLWGAPEQKRSVTGRDPNAARGAGGAKPPEPDADEHQMEHGPATHAEQHARGGADAHPKLRLTVRGRSYKRGGSESED